MERKRTLIWICQEASIRKTSNSALVWSNFTRFQGREGSWVWFLKRRILGSRSHLLQTHILSPILLLPPHPLTPHPPPGSGGEFTLQTRHILLPTRKTRTTQLRAKTQREKFEIFQSNKSHKQLFGTQYSSVLETGRTVATGSRGESGREMG